MVVIKVLLGLLLIKLCYDVVSILLRKFTSFFEFIMINSEYYMERKWILLHKQDEKIDYAHIDMYHPIRGWFPIPSLKDRMFRNSVVNTNSESVRGKKEFLVGKKSILFFGDSFCFGEGVSDNETIPHFFEEKINAFQSINLGVHGYGIDQQYLYLKEVSQKYNPALICFIICYEDFCRNFVNFRDYAKPKFVLDIDKITLTNSPVPQPEHYLKTSKKTCFFPIIFDFIKQTLIYYGIIERKKREKICSYLLDQIKQTVESLNSHLIILYVPNFLRRLLRNYVDNFFIDYFRKKGIPYLNLKDIFSKAEIENMTDPSTRHFSAKGNSLIADKLVELINKCKIV